MIVDTAPPLYGGAGQQAHLLATQLVHHGHHVEVFARQKKRVKSNKDKITKFAKPYIRWEPVSNIAFAILSFAKVITTRPDIVHVHGAYYYGLTSLLAARLIRRPSLLKVTLLGADDPIALIDRGSPRRTIRKVVASQFNLATVVIALNSEIELSVSSYVPHARIETIPNGVEISELSTDKSRIRGGQRFIFAGELGIRKGVDTLLQAWEAVSKELPNAELLLLGPSTPEIEEYIAKMSKFSRARAIFLGSLSRPQVLEHLQASNVFVFPSRQEGLPNALVEAMAQGVACVASDIEVNLTTARGAAMMFPVGDADSLARKMCEAVVVQNQLSEYSSRRAEDFNIETIAGSYNLLYESIAMKI